MNRIALAHELRSLQAQHQNLHVITANLAAYCANHVGKGQCGECDAGIAGECADLLNDRLAVLLMFFTTVARHEERLMKRVSSQHEYLNLFGAHIEDHADLCAELAEIAAAAPSPATDGTASANTIYARVIRLTGRWVTDHFTTYDHALLERLAITPTPITLAETVCLNGLNWLSIATVAAEVGVYAVNSSGAIDSQASVPT